MNLLQYDHQTDLVLDSNQIQLLVDEVFCVKPSPFTRVHLYFVSKEEIARLHGEFFQDPTPTDCITFPFYDKDLLGEIFVCPQMAKEYSPETPYSETSLYIVHALLHLLGYDDIDPQDQIQMRQAEEEVMQILWVKNLVLSNPPSFKQTLCS